MTGMLTKENRTNELIPVYLTANSVNTSNTKQYKKTITLPVGLFFDLIKSKQQIKDITGI